mmetsp:Transcript_33190/g.37688  ORF Transcript_33190/g.37688 Transcript_33190/m.37688 type:complete len:87 (+) Transcript_33190:365-625(+)
MKLPNKPDNNLAERVGSIFVDRFCLAPYQKSLKMENFGLTSELASGNKPFHLRFQKYEKGRKLQERNHLISPLFSLDLLCFLLRFK